jgi:sodium pump decarboxylase gamma subunit
MEQGPLAFAGTVTILGMGVVFSFLALLSVGMLGLRRVQRAAETATPGAPAAGTPHTDAAPARHDARWVAAAVAAYLAATGHFDEVSAAPWDPARRSR